MTANERVVSHVTCLGCGCACDDIRVVVAGERIVEAANACSLGRDWFGDGRVPSRALIAGRESSREDVLDSIAGLLAGAARPIVYLAPDLSCEAQREAVGVADALGALLDSVTSATVSRQVLAAQERGRAGATLGEVRHRADLLVYWGVDPSVRYPRYQSRYTPAIADPSVCRVVAVDVGSSRGPAEAHLRIAIAPRDEVAVLTTLQAAVDMQAANFRTEEPEGEEVWPRGDEASGRRKRLSAIADAVQELASALSGARYAVIVADAEPDPVTADRDPYRADALIALAQALNGPSRGALSLLRAGGNRSGADAVMTWQTGYPMAVDFARGYPTYTPYDGAASRRLSRGEADAVLVIGSAAHVSERDASIAGRTAVIGARASASVFANGAAAIDTGVAGVHEGGTALRMDDVPLPLRASMSGPADTAAIVRALSERIVARRRHAVGGL